ncbi:MAG: hypothetical protein ACF8R7_00055 [Phycisphaerales bacterium JB039]
MFLPVRRGLVTALLLEAAALNVLFVAAPAALVGYAGYKADISQAESVRNGATGAAIAALALVNAALLIAAVLREEKATPRRWAFVVSSILLAGALLLCLWSLWFAVVAAVQLMSIAATLVQVRGLDLKCLQCRYDLSGCTSDWCPECGALIDPPLEVRRRYPGPED